MLVVCVLWSSSSLLITPSSLLTVFYVLSNVMTTQLCCMVNLSLTIRDLVQLQDIAQSFGDECNRK